MSLLSLESNGANGSNRAESLKVWSCVNCRQRKVRCDRRHPCAPCTRNKTECVFPVSGRIPRRAREVRVQKQAELLGGLRRLEAMVGDLGSQVEHVAAVSRGNHQIENSINSATTVTSAASSQETGWSDHHFDLHGQPESGNPLTAHDRVQTGSGMVKGTSELPQVSDEFGDVVVDSNGDLIVGKGFWAVFCKEVEHIFEAVHGPTTIQFDGDGGSSTMSMSGNRHHHSYYDFLLRSTAAARQREDLHPLPSQMLFLWEIYKDNIDPFMKVLHVPTMTKVIRELRGSYHHLGPSMQALVLVISLAAIMSLEDEEVHANFNTDKDQLVTRYRLGTEQALGQADFLNNADITVLQALTIYLGVLQHTGETKSAWFLAGVLVRVMVSMKIHLDGSRIASIAPFEREMRRRLWWQMCFIDSRSEDLRVSEYKLSEEMFDTEIPANTDDANLVPEMSIPPVVVEKWTDMTFFLIRCEVWKLSRRLQSIAASSYTLPPSIDQKLELFRQSQARIENTYLKYLSPNQPLHCFVATVTRLFLTKVELILHTQQHSTRSTESQSVGTSQSDKVFMSSLAIIEYTYALQNEPGWGGWSWQIQGRQPPWHVLRVVLSQLCTYHWEGPIHGRAWSTAKRSLDCLPEEAQRDPRYQQLLMLATTVQRNYAAELDHHHTSGASSTRSSAAAQVDDPIFARAMTTLSAAAPLAQVDIDISEAHLSSTSSTAPQEPMPFSVMQTEDSNNNTLMCDDIILNLEMDYWQAAWDNIAGELELEPSLEFWDMGGGL